MSDGVTFCKVIGTQGTNLSVQQLMVSCLFYYNRASSWLPRVAILQFIAQSSERQYSRRIFHQIRVQPNTELLDVKCHSRCGSPRDFGSVVWLFFPVEKEISNPHVQRVTTVDTVHPGLRLSDRFGLRCDRFFAYFSTFGELAWSFLLRCFFASMFESFLCDCC